MSGFSLATDVETRALEIIRPFAKTFSYNGMIVCPKDGAVGIALQKQFGDLFIQETETKLTSIELKAEEEFTGNLFLETWSNRNLESKLSHAERGSEVGWLYKSRADVLFYYFLNTDHLFVCDMFSLQKWAFGTRGAKKEARIFSFPEKPQGKYSQLNDTWGRCVKIEVLQRELARTTTYYPRQMMEAPEPQIQFNGAEIDVSRGQQYV
jgi:hypothetical protein